MNEIILKLKELLKDFDIDLICKREDCDDCAEIDLCDMLITMKKYFNKQ